MSATTIKKTALITGGSSGIGLAYAKYLLKEGWAVQIVSKNEVPSFRNPTLAIASSRTSGLVHGTIYWQAIVDKVCSEVIF